MDKKEQLKHLRKVLEQIKFFDSMYPCSVEWRDIEAIKLAIKRLGKE